MQGRNEVASLLDVTEQQAKSEPMYWRPWRPWSRTSMQAALKALAAKFPCPACDSQLELVAEHVEASPIENPVIACSSDGCDWQLSVDPAGVSRE